MGLDQMNDFPLQDGSNISCKTWIIMIMLGMKKMNNKV